MKYETRKEHEDIPKAILEAKETIICMKDESEKNIAATRNESPPAVESENHNFSTGLGKSFQHRCFLEKRGVSTC